MEEIMQKRLLCLAAIMLIPVMAHADLNVRDFGAKGDARADDTAAFQHALDAAGKAGDRVNVPSGHYLIRGHLSIPEQVTLAGTFDAPARTQYTQDKLEKEKGSILLAYEGKGHADGTPFIMLHSASHLRGLIVFYPEQVLPDEKAKEPVAFPWTIRGDGDNCTITATLLINPYQAVDFGTRACGRHLIDGLYGQPLKTGLFIDKCFDVGRVSNVHFWPFWRDDKQLEKWTSEHGTAFLIARTDWEYMQDCFDICYQVGYHFTAFKDGPGNAVLTNCGSDVGPLAVRVDSTQAHAGVSFVNGQFMSTIEVGPQSAGPIKFTACGFWGTAQTRQHVRVEKGNTGTVTFDACHFISWAQADKSAPCIDCESGGLIVNASEFLDKDPAHRHIHLGKDVEAAVITSNRFRSPPIIDNQSGGSIEIGLNASPKHAD
jgi:hypothetical protein